MSLVVVIKDKDRFILGADKQVSCGNHKGHTATKVWQVLDYKGCCMGGVGLLRANQIIQYVKGILDKNAFESETGPSEEYVALALTQTIWATLDAHGIHCVEKTAEGAESKYLPGSYIFAYKDKCWLIEADLSIEEVEDFIAIGSGAEVAMGSLIESSKTKLNPYDRIVHAIDAAAEETLYVDHEVEFACTELRKSDLDKQMLALGYHTDQITAVKESLGLVAPKHTLSMTDNTFLEELAEQAEEGKLEDDPEEEQPAKKSKKPIAKKSKKTKKEE